MWQSCLKSDDLGMGLHYIETHLVDHCNLNCRGCGHFAPLSRETFAEFTEFQRDFFRLSQLLPDISVIRMMGGEPLLHPEVLTFLEYARSVFPSAAIHLVTNGLLLSHQKSFFWERMGSGRITLDITRYPIHLDIGKILNAGKCYGVKIQERPETRHFYKYINIEGDSDPSVAFRYCQSFYRCTFLQRGRIYVCPLSALIHIFDEYFNAGIQVRETDSIDIHSDTSESLILQMLDKPSHLCRWCLTEWERFEWGISKRKISEWIGANGIRDPKGITIGER